MNRRVLLALMFCALLLWPAVALAGKSYSADRFDAEWIVQEDGSLLVTETVVFRFSGGPFTYVYRELPTDYCDGIGEFTATMDGRPLTPGQGAGHYEIKGRDPIKVTWRFEGVSDSVHTFVLSYRVAGAVRQEADADLLWWNALPTDYEYRIASSTLRVTYPRTASLIAAPEVRRGQADVTAGAGQVLFSTRDLKSDTPLTVALRFQPGSLIAAAPQWQVRHAEAQKSAPGFGLAALVVLLAGGVGLTAAWTRGRREQPLSLDGMMRLTAPPNDLPPAIAGAINGSAGQPAWPNALAALFDLARRGVLVIEETAERTWYRRHNFIIRLLESPEEASLRPHERGLLDLLFATKTGMATSVKLSDLSNRLSSRWKLFAEPLKADMQAAGLFDAVRQQTRGRFLLWGAALLGLELVAMVGAIVLVVRGSFEGWPFLIVGSIFLLSMAAFVMAGVYSPLSDRAAEMAARWQRFYSYLKDVTKGREPAWDLRQFERYLPYAASYGLAAGWAKAFQQRGGAEIPEWFHAVSATGPEGMGAFVAMTSAVHASGSSASGGAGAGGAGGGGGSGAG
jgi:hypothetical protein